MAGVKDEQQAVAAAAAGTTVRTRRGFTKADFAFAQERSRNARSPIVGKDAIGPSMARVEAILEKYRRR
jgi:hypothetical protein